MAETLTELQKTKFTVVKPIIVQNKKHPFYDKRVTAADNVTDLTFPHLPDIEIDMLVRKGIVKATVAK